MKKVLSTLAIFALVLAIMPIMATPASASTVVNITQDMTPAEVQSAIQTELNAGRDVTVTGTLSDADAGIVLNIPTARKVDWKAAFSGAPNVNLITTSGGGLFEVGEGGLLAATGSGIVIDAQNSLARVTVSGGTVSSETGRAIFLSGAGGAGLVVINSGLVTGANPSTSQATIQTGNHSITVNGGTISSTDRNAVIVALGNITVNDGTIESTGVAINSINTGSTIINNGTVRALGVDWAISLNAARDITINGGVVSGNTGGAVSTQGNITVTGGTVGAELVALSARGNNSKVIVSGGLITSASRSIDRGTIRMDPTSVGPDNMVIISGTAKVINTATETTSDSRANAINTRGNVIIIGGEVISEFGNAVYGIGENSKIVKIGGTVTGRTRFNLTGANAIAVERTGSAPYYAAGSIDGIDVTPARSANVEAYWNVENGEHGISFRRNTNNGFAEVVGVWICDDTDCEHKCPGCDEWGCEPSFEPAAHAECDCGTGFICNSEHICTPHTGLSDMTGQLALAIVFVVMSMGLWGYVIHSKRRRR